ncbi:MAG: metal-dependent hydrolase [Deltaproteobacteria bacterium]|nr:metal-dependent hydrolase [Deltaproteobacteria bacterium]
MRQPPAAALPHLPVRHLAFRFGDDTPFQWNPANPFFGFAMNCLSFVAPPFERYIVGGLRLAMARIGDPALRAAADAFLRQEAQHARAHRLHVAALTRQYPGLAEVSAEIERRFDVLLETEPLEFHLAYAADIEATFTPLFNVWLRHRDTLFDNGDRRVASLFLWHLVEEIEHRSAAYVIYNAVVADRWYRLKVMPRVFAHMLGCSSTIFRGFDRHVPFEARRAPAGELALGPAELGAKLRRLWPFGPGAARPTYPDQLAGVPRTELLRMLYRLVRSQHPRHSPADEPIPPFADEWLAAHARGRDVVNWYAEGLCPRIQFGPPSSPSPADAGEGTEPTRFVADGRHGSDSFSRTAGECQDGGPKWLVGQSHAQDDRAAH